MLVWSRDKKTIWLEAHWFAKSIKVTNTKNSASKVMVSVFSHRDRILLVDYLEKGATITDSYYTPLLDKVKQAMVSKQQESCQKECCFSRTMPPHTWLSSHSGNWRICTLKYWHTLPVHLIWPFQTTICSETLKISEQDEIFVHWRFHICCRWLVCSPTFSILSEWFTEAAAV